jgi:hypothetical protein
MKLSANSLTDLVQVDNGLKNQDILKKNGQPAELSLVTMLSHIPENNNDFYFSAPSAASDIKRGARGAFGLSSQMEFPYDEQIGFNDKNLAKDYHTTNQDE